MRFISAVTELTVIGFLPLPITALEDARGLERCGRARSSQRGPGWGEFSENRYQRVPGEENTAADKNLPDNGRSAIPVHPKPPIAGVQAAPPSPPSALSTAPGLVERAAPKR